jgi:hypothetical protein
MIRGEEGRQRREVARLVDGLAREGRPDVFVLSNAMLIGVARTLERQLRVPVVCTLQGEAPFLDSFPEPARGQAWAALAERARGVHAFVGVSRSYADLMTARMELDPERVHVVHHGIDPTDFASGPGASRPERPTVGYLARMCPDKGLDTLVEAFCRLHRGGRVPGVRLRAAGVLLEGDRPFGLSLPCALGSDRAHGPHVQAPGSPAGRHGPAHDPPAVPSHSSNGGSTTPFPHAAFTAVGTHSSRVFVLRIVHAPSALSVPMPPTSTRRGSVFVL